MKSPFYILLVFILPINIALGQDGHLKAPAEKEVLVPFVLTEYNNLVMQATLNGRDSVKLMFHTAESEVTLTEEASRKAKSVHFGGMADSVKSWGGQDNSSRFSKGNLVQMGDLRWEDMRIWEDLNSGRGTDGKFGADLFAGKVISIDFDKKIITIGANLPEEAKGYQKLRLFFQRNNMFVELGIQTDTGICLNRFLIHSGYSGDLLLDDQFVKDHHLDERLQVVAEKSLKDSYGNIIKTRRAIMPVVMVGSQRLGNVPVGFFPGAIGRQKMSILGADILKRFNIIIDARREYIYLKANSLKGDKYAEV